MEDPQFTYTLIDMMPLFAKAAAEAEELLSWKMRGAHRIELNKGPNAWEAVAAAYGRDPETTPLQKVALAAMVGIVTAHQKILGVLEYAKLLNAAPPDLRLGKMSKEGWAK